MTYYILIALLVVWTLAEAMFRPRLVYTKSGWFMFYGRFERDWIKLL